MFPTRPLVLVVDDETYITELLSELLTEEFNYEVVTAFNGVQALALAQQRRPTIIITDLMMPQMDGQAFVRALRSDAALCTVPIITSSAIPQKPQWVHNEGLLFIPKPFDVDDLLSIVHQLVNQSRLA